VPGDVRRDYEQGEQAGRILEDAESDLRGGESTGESISPTGTELGASLRPGTGNEQRFQSDGGREVSSEQKETAEEITEPSIAQG
jgi:hypothetical protein